MTEEMKATIASVLYPDDPLTRALKYVNTDTTTGKKLYSMREIFKCVDAVLASQQNSIHSSVDDNIGPLSHWND